VSAPRAVLGVLSHSRGYRKAWETTKTLQHSAERVARAYRSLQPVAYLPAVPLRSAIRWEKQQNPALALIETRAA